MALTPEGRDALGLSLDRFASAYTAATTRLRGTEHIAAWWRLSLTEPRVTAPIAASWAQIGFTAAAAGPLIAEGITAARVRALMWRAGRQLDGGEAERAAAIIDGLVADGVLVDPARVTWREDPDDPTHIIVDIRPERG